MYQVTIKGRTLEELKAAVNDINNELSNGVNLVDGMEKELPHTTKTFTVPSSETKYNTTIGPTYTSAPALAARLAEELASTIIEPVVEVAPLKVAPSDTPLQIFDAQNNVEVDINGLPWDKRIHSSSRAKIKAGNWKKKKGLDANVEAQVKTELLAAIEAQKNPVVIPDAPIAPNTPVIPTVIAPVEVPVVQAPVVAPVAPPVQPLQNASGHSFDTFKTNFPMIVGTLISENKLTPAYVNQLKDYFKVTEIWSVTDEQKLEMFESFASFGFIQKVA